MNIVSLINRTASHVAIWWSKILFLLKFSDGSRGSDVWRGQLVDLAFHFRGPWRYCALMCRWNRSLAFVQMVSSGVESSRFHGTETERGTVTMPDGHRDTLFLLLIHSHGASAVSPSRLSKLPFTRGTVNNNKRPQTKTFHCGVQRRQDHIVFISLTCTYTYLLWNIPDLVSHDALFDVFFCHAFNWIVFLI